MLVSTHAYWRRLLSAAVLLIMFSARSIASDIQSFDLDAGDATQTLKEFAKQSRLSIVFDPQGVKGVQTQEVVGMLLAKDALERMLESTSLVFNEDLETGAFAVTRSEVPAASLTTQSTEPKPIEETEMNTTKNNWLKTLAAVLTLGISGGSAGLSGQEDADQEPIFDLSPFTVDASEDTGYSATSTLAGTRIRTDLRDLGSSISVVTSEFLEDTGATDAASLLSYMGSTEVGGAHGNFSGAEASDTGRFVQPGERANPQFNQRIRGLGAADLTRGLFLTEIPFDSYNTDRVTVSRGPNSLLFGIGSPGGVIDNSLKPAIQNTNFGELKIRFDNYGSLRTELDFNKNLVDGRVALRIAALKDDQEFKQEPAFEDAERFYAAMNIVLFKNESSNALDATRFKVNGEWGKSNALPVEIIPPTVAYHGWFEPIPKSIEQFSGSPPTSVALSPSEGGTWEYQATYNPFLSSDESDINTNSHQWIARHISAVFSQNNNIPDYGTGDGLQGSTGLIPWRTNLDTLDSSGLAGTPGAINAFGVNAPGDTPVAQTVERHTNSPYSEPYAIGFAVPSLQNRNVFDYRNLIYSGDLDRVERKFDVQNFALEQSFFQNQFGVELAYDNQHYESTRDFLFSGGESFSTSGPYDIYVSIAEFLQNGQVNPNLGRAYSRARPQIQFNEIDRETVRLTAFAKLDFTESDGILKYLGNHRLTGLFNDHTRDERSLSYGDAWISNDFDIASAVQGDTINHFRRPVNVTVFTSDSLLGLSSIDDVRIRQVGLSRRPQPGDSFTVQFADTSSATAPRKLDVGTVTVERFLNPNPSAGELGISRTEIESKALAWQSYFLNDHIIGLVGYREDDTKSFSMANEDEVGFDNQLPDGRFNPEFMRLSKTPSLEESGDTLTWSLVSRLPQNFIGGHDIRLHYAESENFNPVGLRNNAFGQPIGQPTGTTKEYGVLGSFLENKFVVKLNWFETALNNINAGPTINVANEAFGRINGYRDAELMGIDFSEQLVTVQGDPAAFPIQDYNTFYNIIQNSLPQQLLDVINPRQVDTDGDGLWDTIERDGIPNLVSVADRVAEGFEIEMTAALTPGWRIQANVSKQETIQSNTASAMARAVEEYNSNLQSSRAGELNRSPDLTVITRSINEIWLPNSLAPVRGAKALDNTVTNEQRKWRFNLITNYEFLEGAFRGFGIGGATRWEDEAATGYVFVLDPESGVPIPDVNRPFLDDGLFSGDLWLSYGRKLFDDKVDWKIQLNVRNAFGDDDDIPVKTNPDGQVAVIRIPNPRTIYLSNSFKF